MVPQSELLYKINKTNSSNNLLFYPKVKSWPSRYFSKLKDLGKITD